MFKTHSSQNLNEKGNSIVHYLADYVFSTAFEKLCCSRQQMERNEESSEPLNTLMVEKMGYIYLGEPQ